MCQAEPTKVGQVFCLQTDLSDGNMWDIGGRIGIGDEGNLVKTVLPKPGGRLKTQPY